MSETESIMSNSEESSDTVRVDSSQDSHDYDDDLGGVTPGPNTTHTFFAVSVTVDDDSEEEWINPSPPPPSMSVLITGQVTPVLCATPHAGPWPVEPQGHFPFPSANRVLGDTSYGG